MRPIPEDPNNGGDNLIGIDSLIKHEPYPDNRYSNLMHSRERFESSNINELSHRGQPSQQGEHQEIMQFYAEHKNSAYQRSRLLSVLTHISDNRLEQALVSTHKDCINSNHKLGNLAFSEVTESKRNKDELNTLSKLASIDPQIDLKSNL